MSKGDKVADSLPQRMREAAEVLREADRRCHGRIEGWTPLDLEGTAEAWESEDRAKAEQEAAVEELAKWLSIHIGTWPEDEWHLRAKPNYWHDKARELMDAGWRKGGSDE